MKPNRTYKGKKQRLIKPEWEKSPEDKFAWKLAKKILKQFPKKPAEDSLQSPEELLTMKIGSLLLKATRWISHGISRDEVLHDIRYFSSTGDNEPPLSISDQNVIRIINFAWDTCKNPNPQRPGQETQTATSANEFPKEAIGGLAGEFADLYSSYLESPWEFFAFYFLTCLGSIVAGRVTIASGITPQPRLYTVAIGESADDRKSEAIKQTVGFYENAFEEEDLKLCHGVGSAEGLARKLTEAQAGEKKKMLLVYDELKAFVGKAILEGATLLPVVNTFFDNNTFHTATKSHKIELNDVYLSLLGASTIDTFSHMWTSAFLDIGFLNRLWLVKGHGERRFSIPRKIPEQKKIALQEKLRDLLAKYPPYATKHLIVNKNARHHFDKWYMK